MAVEDADPLAVLGEELKRTAASPEGRARLAVILCSPPARAPCTNAELSHGFPFTLLEPPFN